MSFFKAVEGLHVVLFPLGGLIWADASYASFLRSNRPLLRRELRKKLEWVKDSVALRAALGRVEMSNCGAHGVVGEAQVSSACLAARKALTKGYLVDAAVKVGEPRNLKLCQAVRDS